MPAGKEDGRAATNRTTVERKADRELIVTRAFNAPAHIVFEAWSKPELFKQWWVPKSAGLTLVSCDIDKRTAGGYRPVFRHPASSEPSCPSNAFLTADASAHEKIDEGAFTR
jgi:hypothetical protein